MKNTQDKPATFIVKLTNILRSKEHAKVISWDHQEKGIKIQNQQKLQQSVLPRFYRHNKFASFVRQLNMYNFHKIYLSDHSSIFYHQTYDPKNKENLHLIRRKSTFLGQENQIINNPPQKIQTQMKSAFRLSLKETLKENSKNQQQPNQEQVLQEIINQFNPLELSQISIKNKIAELRVHKKFGRFLKRGSFLEKLYARLGIQMGNNQDKLSQLSIEEQLMFKTKKSIPQKSLKFFDSGNLHFLDSLGFLLN